MIFKKEFVWGPGATYKVPAATVGGVLGWIESRDGEVTKKSFLDESRPAESPTHELFEWRDDVAAERYRLRQAGQIMNNLRVIVVTGDSDDSERVLPAVVNVVEGRKTGRFRSLEVACRDADSREIVLRNAWHELEEFRRKYETLREFAWLFDDMEEHHESL